MIIITKKKGKKGFAMEKEEMKSNLLKLAGIFEDVQSELKIADEFDIPYEAFDVMTQGTYYQFDGFSSVSFSEWIRSACASGQLTQREMPNKGGVYVKEESIRAWGKTFNDLAQLDFAKVEHLIPHYEEFVPVAEALKGKAEFATQACVEILSLIQAYIDEAKKEPFKESWKTFSSSLSGLCQTIEAYLKDDNWGGQIRATELEVKVKQSIEYVRMLSKELKDLGYAWDTDSVNDDKLRDFESDLWDVSIKVQGANRDVSDSKIGYEFKELFEQLYNTLLNMSRFIDM
jgi:hypothetical protein